MQNDVFDFNSYQISLTYRPMRSLVTDMDRRHAMSCYHRIQKTRIVAKDVTYLKIKKNYDDLFLKKLLFNYSNKPDAQRMTT